MRSSWPPGKGICLYLHKLWWGTVLQIRTGERDNLGIIKSCLSIKTFCDPSLEPSYRDGSNEGLNVFF